MEEDEDQTLLSIFAEGNKVQVMDGWMDRQIDIEIDIDRESDREIDKTLFVTF